MSQKIDARQVLECLNELGYTGINASQLKQFIKDLKLLMKYDIRLQESQITTDTFHEHDSRTTKDDSCFSSRGSVSDEHSVGSRKNNVHDYLYSKETISSEAKKAKAKESIISVQIKRSNLSIGVRQSKPHVHCIHDTTASTQATNISKNDSDTQEYNTSTFGQDVSHSNADCTVDVSRDTVDEKESGYSKPCRSKNALKPKASFIRPRIGKSFKTDPVALYHQYQEEWRRQKIPGEDNRADLRWAIREKMLGAPMVISSSGQVSSRRRPNSCQA